MVSTFLQKRLERLSIEDPFKLRNSEEIVEEMRLGKFERCTAFSVDVVDLYYSLPQRELMKCAEECIGDSNDDLIFQNDCGLTVEGFLELLFYLRSTFIKWEQKVLLQNAGVCIGSRVAPIPSNILLGKVDVNLEKVLGGKVVRVARYIDDYLVFVHRNEASMNCEGIVKAFEDHCMGLRFTKELPAEGSLQFLDLAINFAENHTRWKYNPRSPKPLLNYASGISK